MTDPLLCPPWWGDEPEASRRPLTPEAARALGASAMADLAIRGTARREAAADRACATLLTDGDLGRAVADALSLLASPEGGDPVRVERCARRLEGLLAAEEDAEPYRDDACRVWRFFNTYAERGLHNRLSGPDGREVRLVPAPYYHAHGTLSSLSMRLGRADRALAFALRAVELDPMDVNARLRAARCHELLGDAPMAEATVRELLSLAHDPDSICAAYLRLGGALRQEGELRLADASLRHALAVGGVCAPAAAKALGDLQAQGGYEPAPAGTVADELEGAGIPLAPVARVGEVLVDGAKAAVDAGIFPVARDLTTLVGILTNDESLLTVALSMEADA